MRIASLLPSATEIVCSLGLEDDLVAVTHECDYPESVRAKPVADTERAVRGEHRRGGGPPHSRARPPAEQHLRARRPSSGGAPPRPDLDARTVRRLCRLLSNLRARRSPAGVVAPARVPGTGEPRGCLPEHPLRRPPGRPA